MNDNAGLASATASNLAGLLKPLGYRKRRYTFNRDAEDGLTQVISLQLGRYEFEDQESGESRRAAYIAAGFEPPPELYGMYTVNLGVYVPEMDRFRGDGRDWVSESSCQYRWRIGEVVPAGVERRDVWWRLGDPDEEAEALRRIGTDALERLAAYSTRDQIVQRHAETQALGWVWHQGVNNLRLAELLESLGRRPEAERAVSEYVDRVLSDLGEEGARPNHARYLVQYLPTRGYSDLAEAVRSRLAEFGDTSDQAGAN